MGNVVDIAIKEAGGLSALARSVGVKPPSVCKWRKTGLIPLARVDAVEALTGIPREKLRPDFFRPALPLCPVGGDRGVVGLCARRDRATVCSLSPSSRAWAGLNTAWSRLFPSCRWSGDEAVTNVMNTAVSMMDCVPNSTSGSSARLPSLSVWNGTAMNLSCQQIGKN